MKMGLRSSRLFLALMDSFRLQIYGICPRSSIWFSGRLEVTLNRAVSGSTFLSSGNHRDGDLGLGLLGRFAGDAPCRDVPNRSGTVSWSYMGTIFGSSGVAD